MSDETSKKSQDLITRGACIGFGVGFVTAAIAARFVPKPTLATWLSLRFNGFILDCSVCMLSMLWIMFCLAIGRLVCARIGHLSLGCRSIDYIIRSGVIVSIVGFFLSASSIWPFVFGIMWVVIATSDSIAYNKDD